FLLAGAVLIALLVAGLAVFLYQSRTRARRDAAQIQALNHDLHHRTGNHLQLLQGALGKQVNIQREGEVKDALGTTQQRLEAVNRLYLHLYGVEDRPFISIPDLVEPIVTNIERLTGIEAGTVIQTGTLAVLDLPSSQAVPLALILNEWLTNGCKYVLPHTDIPEIHLSIHHLGDGLLQVSYADNGPGYDPEQARIGASGLGLVNSLVRQLGGQLTKHTDTGTRYELNIRLRGR
ncbi:MAG: ATP-binding protein, partial [Bacteroidota bacterium]